MTGSINGLAIFPQDNIWNTPITALPVHAQSATWLSTLGLSSFFNMAQLWPGAPFPLEGMPITLVDGSQPLVTITITGFPAESDPGPYPIPATAGVEGYTGDQHVIVIDSTRKMLYEMFGASYNGDTTWNCLSAAKWDLTSNALRTNGHTSADAAGLPIFPGLVRYQEVAIEGRIAHALRGAVQHTHAGYLWPARHDADVGGTTGFPPLGARLRLKASFDTSSFGTWNKIIFQALKTYGFFIADNTGNAGVFKIEGAPDTRWTSAGFNDAGPYPTLADFDVVDESSLQVSADSGAQAGINYKYMGGFAL